MQLQITSPHTTQQERRIRFKSTLMFAVCWLLIFFSCNDSFQPLQENDQYYFSIYGTLDAAVDTQWVRIGIPRENINEPPDPSRIQVTLEDLQSGKTVLMQDSLFASKDLLNYWTTMPVKNEQTYLIKAERKDGKSSTVTVTIPDELPTPIVWENKSSVPLGVPAHIPGPKGFFIYIDDSVEHIVDVQSKWYVLVHPLTERLKKTYTFTYRNTLKHTESLGGAWFTFADTTEERESITNNANIDFAILHQQFFVAAGGPEWDENISSINDLEYFLDGTASNVENGLGYVVGIDSKWMPYKTCLTADSSNVIPCEPEEPFW